MNLILLIAIFIVMLFVLVMVHELGHFLTAKKFKIRVDEFGFGFPPRLWGKKIGETLYSLNALPFGGFVKIFGENPDAENTSGPDAGRSFVNKPAYVKALVLAAGVVANFLLAWVLFTASFAIGLQNIVPDEGPPGVRISSVLENSPASRAGLKEGDKIIYASDSGVFLGTPDLESFQNFISARADKEIGISYMRAGEREETRAVPESGIVDGKPGIGIVVEANEIKLPLHEAAAAGLKESFLVVKAVAVQFYMMVTGSADFANVSGPVGIVKEVGHAYDRGFSFLLYLAALISANLAFINLLPFPALDGGRLLFILIEKIKGSKISANTANVFNLVGFALLILLMFVVTYQDIAKLMRPS